MRIFMTRNGMVDRFHGEAFLCIESHVLRHPNWYIEFFRHDEDTLIMAQVFAPNRSRAIISGDRACERVRSAQSNLEFIGRCHCFLVFGCRLRSLHVHDASHNKPVAWKGADNRILSGLGRRHEFKNGPRMVRDHFGGKENLGRVR